MEEYMKEAIKMTKSMVIVSKIEIIAKKNEVWL